MNKDITEYQALIFDCDGVILNSNKIKTQAFYDVANVYGHEPAQALKAYHVQNGGISRYAKFEYFIADILKKTLDKMELQQLLDNFAYEVKKALMTCEVADGLDLLRKKTRYAKWFIVSGGDQGELIEVFAARGLDSYFDGGIFGSPDDKDAILANELKNNNITQPALFLGDSKYDYQAAQTAGIDFTFLTDWTEVRDWQSWINENNLKKCRNLTDLAHL